MNITYGRQSKNDRIPKNDGKAPFLDSKRPGCYITRSFNESTALAYA
jgi:hypothetical protein